MPTYAQFLAGLDAALVLALDGATGLTDLSGQGRNGTAAGGLTVGAADGPPVSVAGGATDFDGTDDRIEVFSADRINGIPNPDFVGTANWSFSLSAWGTGTGTLTSVADPGGMYYGKVVGAHAADSVDRQTQLDSSPWWDAPALEVTPGESVRARLDLKHVTGAYRGGVDGIYHFYLMFFTSAGSYISAAATSHPSGIISDYTPGAWKTYETVTATVPATAAYCKISVRWRSSLSGEAYEHHVRRPILEKTSTAIGPYFSGNGYMDGSVWTPSLWNVCGWRGAENASQSGYGYKGYPTRRNHAVKPLARSGAPSLTLGYQSTVAAVAGSGESGNDYFTRATATGVTGGQFGPYGNDSIATAAGEVWTFSANILKESENGSRLIFAVRDSGGSVLSYPYKDFTGTGRKYFTATMPASAADFRLGVYGLSDTVGDTIEFDGLLCEKAPSYGGQYFPTPAQLASGEAGWHGTPYATKSDLGCFANGTARTVMGWLYRDVEADAEDVFFSSITPDGSARSYLRFLANGDAQFAVLNSPGTTISGVLPAGGWHHVALTFDEPAASNNVKLYVDGSPVATQLHTSQFDLVSSGIQFGQRAVSTGRFDGRMAWLSVHERVLTDDEILDAAEFADPTRSGSPLPRTDIRPLSLKAEELLADLPPYEADSVWVQDLMDAVGREIERLDEFVAFIREALRPQNADDQYRLLGMWESLMGLPVEPPGVALAARQDRVKAAARKRLAGEGAGWVTAISLAIGTYAWTHRENQPGDYQLTVEIPFPSDAFSAGVLEAMLRSVTPAALQITVIYTDSFRVGISEVGDSL